MWRRQKGESLISTRLINGLWRCPLIDVNARSRDCHATDALHDHAKQYDNDECVMINRMVESCMAIYL